MVKMKLAAQKALELDDTLAEAHTSLADAKFRGDWDWSGAEREFKRALELKPNYAEGHEWYSQYLAAMGRFDESIAEGKWARQLDPVSPGISRNLGFDYYFARRYDQAVEEYRRALDLDPNFYFAHWLLGIAYARQSMFEQAVAESRKAVELSGRGPGALGGLGCVYAVSGRRDEARQVLDELKEMAKRRHVSPYSLAAIYALLGDRDAAFEWLEKAYREGAYGILFINVAPEWDGLRSEPRFRLLMQRVGLPQ
jgi:adenylate cyclase